MLPYREAHPKKIFANLHANSHGSTCHNTAEGLNTSHSNLENPPDRQYPQRSFLDHYIASLDPWTRPYDSEWPLGILSEEFVAPDFLEAAGSVGGILRRYAEQNPPTQREASLDAGPALERAQIPNTTDATARAPVLTAGQGHDITHEPPTPPLLVVVDHLMHLRTTQAQSVLERERRRIRSARDTFDARSVAAHHGQGGVVGRVSQTTAVRENRMRVPPPGASAEELMRWSREAVEDAWRAAEAREHAEQGKEAQQAHEQQAHEAGSMPGKRQESTARSAALPGLRPPGPDGRLSCIICWEAPKCMMAVPCNHVLYCESCAAKVSELCKSCPICRMGTTDCVKIYL